MRKIVLYIATSLNGKIARKDGSVDWLESLPNPEKTDHGYLEFLESVDTTIMGNSTYQQLLSWGIDFPYRGKTNYVFTNDVHLVKDENVEYVSMDQEQFVKEIIDKPGKDIWLIGGGQLNTFFFNHNLINEIRLFLMPIVIPDGIELFEAIPKENQLILKETKSWSSGAVELRYSLNTD